MDHDLGISFGETRRNYVVKIWLRNRLMMYLELKESDEKRLRDLIMKAREPWFYSVIGIKECCSNYGRN